MTVSVFLSNKSIQVAIGNGSKSRIKVNSFFSDDMPEGTLLNGTVINEKTLEDTIRGTWMKHGIKAKKVNLVINSPNLVARRIEMPLMKGSKCDNYVTNEADEKDIARFNDPIIGWYPVSKKQKTQIVVSETSEKEFIETYVRIFENVGIKLNSIHGGINLAVNMLQAQIGQATAVYMIIDGMTLTTMLFAKGNYYNNLSTRIYAQPGTPEFPSEIRNAVSSIRQFAKTQQIDDEITDIYISGLSSLEMQSLESGLAELSMGDSIKAASCPSNVSLGRGREKFGDFIFAFAGLFDNDDGLTLTEGLKKSSEKYANKLNLIKLAIPYIISIVVLSVISVSLFAMLQEKEKKLSKLEKYNNSDEVIEAAAKYEDMMTSIEIYGQAQGSADLLEAFIESYPTPDSSVNTAIEDAAKEKDVKVEFDSYSADTGILSLIATGADVEKINLFIASLMELDILQNVDYTGYTQNESDGTWSINVVCTLAEGN